MKKVLKIASIIPIFFVFCFFCLNFAFTKPVASAKTDDFEAFSQSFQTMMQNAENDYVEPIYINLDKDASLVEKTYMIDVATFSELTDVDVIEDSGDIELSNDFSILKCNQENENVKINAKSKALEKTGLYDDGVLYLPLEEVALNFGFSVDIEKNTAKLIRPYQTKRVVVETKESVLDMGASFVAEGYKGIHIFQYDTEQQTKEAFESLKNKYSNALVYLDSVVSLDDTEINGKSDSFSYTNIKGAEATGANKYSTYLLDDVDESSLPEVVVAVVDTGIDTDHPWFTDRIKAGGRAYFSSNPTTSYEDDNGHGTHVAGTIVDLTLKNVKILPIKVLDSSGYGSSVNIRYALEYVITKKQEGVNIVAINMSFGSDSTVGSAEQQAYQNVLTTAYQKGMLCVAAAGNDHKDASAQSPANVPISITVSALKDVGNSYIFDSSYSNYGSYVDFCAPGTGIKSALRGGGTTSLSGTSMAAPHVSAIIALLYSDIHESNLTPERIESKLKEYAVDLGEIGWDQYYGYGLPDISYAYSTSIKDVEFSNTETEVASSFYLTLTHSNPSAEIYFTLDGSTPTHTNGTLYASPILIDKTCVVKAVAIVVEGTDVVASSLVKTMTYVLNNQDFDSNFVVQNGALTLYNGNLSMLKVPSQINGQEITKIGKNAFSNSSCTIIYLPETVTEIEANAFEGLTTLTEIFAPGVTQTGNYSFSGCYNLDLIDDEHFPKLLNIGKLCFYDCYNIKSVSLSKAVIVDYWAFSMSGYQNSTLLKSVDLPEVLTVNGGAFYYCTSLKNVNLPKCQIVSSNAFYCTGLLEIDLPEVVLVGSQAFYGSSNLKSVNLPKAITIGDSCFRELTSLSEINLPNLELAGAFAFAGCLSLETLNLPNLTKAGTYAFAECSKLLNFDLSNVRQIETSAFFGTTFESINLPSVTQISKNAFYGNTNLKIIKLSPNLQIFEQPFDASIYQSLVMYLYEGTPAENFADTNNISYIYQNSTSNLSFYVQNKKVFITGFVDDGKEIVVPSTISGKPVETICSNAFSGAQNLKKVINYNLKTIESNAFSNCENLEIFECPNVEKISKNAFFGCKKLSSLTISNVVFVDENAFLGCESLEYAMFSSNITYLGEKSFGFNLDGSLIEDFVLYGYENTVVSTYAEENEITFRARFSELSRYYYNYVDSTKRDIYISFVDESVSGRVSLPSKFTDGDEVEHTVTAIGSQAFSYCSFITEILMPDTIKTVDTKAFIGCCLLRSINLENVTTLGRYAFQDCTSLQYVNLKSLTSVPAYAFYGCYALEVVNAQNAVTVGYCAFANCISLSDIKLTSAQILGTTSSQVLYGNIFVNCQSLEYVALPKAVQFGTSLFDGAGTKFVVLGASTISAYPSSISSSITIYGYSGTGAQSFANQYSNPFVAINNFAIKKDILESVSVSQFDELNLSVEVDGFLLTYEWFYSTGEKIDESSNTLSIDTNTVQTKGYVVEITNFDGQKLVSNICEVSVVESLTKVLVDYKIYGFGNLSLEEENIFEVGTNPVVTFTPKLGCFVSSIWIDGILLNENELNQAVLNGFVFENISQTHLVEVLFEIQTFSVTVSLQNATVTNLLESYDYGTSTTLYIIPDDGFEVLQVFVDGTLSDSKSKVLFSNITANHTISVLVRPRTDTPYKVLHFIQSFEETEYVFDNVFYEIYFVESKTGTTNQLTQAESKEISGCLPKSFSQTTILGDGTSVVNILYTKQVFSLTLSMNSGFVSVLGAGNYLYGEDVTISAVLKDGCSFSYWKSNDENVVSNGYTLTYTFKMPAQNFGLKAMTVVPTFLIEVNSVLHGKNTTQSGYAEKEENFVVNIVADIGFTLENIFVDDVQVSSETLLQAKETNVFTLENVTKTHTITITYQALSFSVNFAETENGSVSPQNFNTTILDKTTVTILPDLGYELDRIEKNGKAILGLDFEKILQYGFVVENIGENTTFNVVFKIKTFIIVSSSNDENLGFVTDSKTVDFGQNTSFDIIVFDGNYIEDVLVDGESVGSVENYVFENVTKSHTLQVVFAKIVFSITVELDENGTFEGETSAFYGDDVVITLIPNVGFEVHNVLVNGVSVGNSLEILFENITENKTIEVTFTKILLTVTVEYSENGVVSFGKVNIASSPKTVEYGDSVSLRIVPNECFGIDYIIKNGEYEKVSNSLSFVVKENIYIFVQFANEFEIVSDSNGNGEISEGSIVSFGENKTFLIRAEEGYVINDVLVDGESVGSVEFYTFEKVDTRHTISAIFSVQTFKILTDVSGSGAIVVDNLDPAVSGEERTFTFVAQDGFYLDQVYVNGELVKIEDNTLVLTIEKDTTVKAVFVKSNTLAIVVILSSCIGVVGVVTLVIAIILAVRRK